METASSFNHSGRIFAAYRRYFPRWPSSIDIELTNRCNLSCPSCWFHGENGVGDRYRGAELDTSEVLEFIDHVAPHRPSLYFGGAEPLLREDFLTIAAHVKSHGLPMAFTTNGTLLTPEASKKLVEAEIDQINLSIDGPEDVHDRLRGRGNFTKTVSNLRYLLDCRSVRSVDRPFVTVNITLNPAVVGRLDETITSVRGAVEDRVDSYRIHHLWFISPDELRLHQAVVQKALGCSAPGAGAHQLSSSRAIDVAALSQEISRLRGLSRVTFFPDLVGEEIEQFYGEGRQGTKGCRAPFRSVVVKPNGEVRFCPDEWIDDYVLGNIREAGLGEIWWSRRARRFRRALLLRGSFPGCRRCSWLR
jgi:radical SAM protein with 4Fe4S-binding SPASM domain